MIDLAFTDNYKNSFLQSAFYICYMSLKKIFDYAEDQWYPIWFLDNSGSSIRLYQIDETNYFVIEHGNLTPIISNPSFVLVNLELLNFFRSHVQSDLKPKPVGITDRSTNSHIKEYYSITAAPITIQSLSTLNYDGNKIWIDADCGAIFISSALKKHLEKAMLPGLNCFPGYSMFGA